MRRAMVTTLALAAAAAIGGCPDEGARTAPAATEAAVEDAGLEAAPDAPEDGTAAPADGPAGDEAASAGDAETAVVRDPVLGAPRRPEAWGTGREPAPGAGDAGLAIAPKAAQRRIEVRPEAPRAGQAFEIRGGPITFRNGCEGVDDVTLDREGDRLSVTWRPRTVPPDAMCTMALHDEWVTVQVPGLSAGRYVVRVEQVGERTLEVGP